MCKQRGWKPDSKQPERYARIVTKDVDSYYAKKFGKWRRNKIKDNQSLEDAQDARIECTGNRLLL